LSLCTPSDGELGLAGESLAARYLAGRGARILARRLDTAHGEIDLVIAEGDVLVCVEVKSGVSGPLHRPGSRLTRSKIARLSSAARALARERGLCRARVDLIEVLFEPGAGRPRLPPRFTRERASVRRDELAVRGNPAQIPPGACR
jgi:putative endonuclease